MFTRFDKYAYVLEAVTVVSLIIKRIKLKLQRQTIEEFRRLRAVIALYCVSSSLQYL